MSVKEFILGLFKSPQKTLNDLKPGEVELQIRKEKNRVERNQEKIKELQVQMELKYKESVGESEILKKIMAQEIVYIEDQITQYSNVAEMTTNAIGTLYTILGVKKAIEIQFTGPVWDVILQHVTIDDIVEWIEEKNLKQEEILERMREIRRVKIGGRITKSEDPKVQAVLERMAHIELSMELEEEESLIKDKDPAREPV